MSVSYSALYKTTCEACMCRNMPSSLEPSTRVALHCFIANLELPANHFMGVIRPTLRGVIQARQFLKAAVAVATPRPQIPQLTMVTLRLTPVAEVAGLWPHLRLCNSLTFSKVTVPT